MPTEYTNLRIDISHVLLPLSVLVGLSGGPTTRTAISQADGGLEFRKAKRPMPLREYTASYGPDDVAAVQALFYCQIGPAKCFMMRDRTDYQARAVPLVKVGSTSCQLRQQFKTINYFSLSTLDVVYRDIVLPDPATLVVYEGGIAAGGWSIGSDGVISKAGAVGADVTADVDYFTPVRFTNDRLDIASHGGTVTSVQQFQLTEVLPRPAA